MSSMSKKTIALWVAQIILATIFALAGFMKATQPIADLAAMMGWPGQAPVALVRFIGIAELAGAVGLVLPVLTGIMPRLTALAALGLAVVQVLAMGLHIYRGEFEVLPINVILLALAVFVTQGRRTVSPNPAIAE